MAAPDYDIVVVDLATARPSPEQVAGQGNRINGVTILTVPGGAVANVHFGSGRQPIPVSAGDSWVIAADGPNGCPVPLDEGLFFSNPAGAGLVTMLVSYGQVGGGVVAV